MNLRLLILIGVSGLLTFLLYPRSEQAKIIVEQNWIQNAKKVDNEPLHYSVIRKDAKPVVNTYDVGYIYKVDKALLEFEAPVEKGPKQYDIFTSIHRAKQYTRVFSYTANSREYTYTVQPFPVAKEARWVQVSINEIFSAVPTIKSFKIGAQYTSQMPIISVTANCNSVDLYKLTDGIASEPSKWTAAKRTKGRVGALSPTDGEKGKKNIKFEMEDDVIVTCDLGIVKKVYGIRLTTDGPGTNAKRYSVFLSSDGQKYRKVYTSPELEDKTVVDKFLYKTDEEEPQPHRVVPTNNIPEARYVRLVIKNGDWYGDYAEIQEFEVFTDEYRLPTSEPEDINEYNAIQAYYDDCGADGIKAPNLIQGFPFDRGEKIDMNVRYFFKDGDEVEPGNTASQKSCSYHYDTVILKYDSLNPNALYWVFVTYLQEKNRGRIQNLLADGFILHAPIPGSSFLPNIPQGKAQNYTFFIPPETYSDGILELHFNRLAGQNAYVSEVSLMEAQRTKGTARIVIGTLGQQTAKATKISISPVIDGLLGDWPNLYPLIPNGITHVEESAVATYLQWDENNLYVGVEVDRVALAKFANKKVKFNDFGDYTDTLHIFVGMAKNAHPRMYTNSDHHFAFRLLGAKDYLKRVRPSQIHHHLDAIKTTINNSKEIEFATQIQVDKTPKIYKYVLEARIPKGKVLQEYNPEMYSTVGFNYILESRVARGTAAEHIHWASPNIAAAPGEWLPVAFVGSTSGEILIMDETATKKLDNFNAGDVITLCVFDEDRDTDISSTQSVEVEISGDLTKDRKQLKLYETTLESLANGFVSHEGIHPFETKTDDEKATNSNLFAVKLKTEYNDESGITNYELQMEKNPSSFSLQPSAFHVRGGEKVTSIYIDPYYAFGKKGEKVICLATVNTGTTGTISILSESGTSISEFNAGETLVLEVTDADVWKAEGEKNDVGKVEVIVSVDGTDESEKIELANSDNQKLFRGELRTEYNVNAKPGDGKLQIVGNQILIATYLDRIQNTGRTNAPVRAETKTRTGSTAEIFLNATRVGYGVASERNEKSLRPSTSAGKYLNAGDTVSVHLKDADLNKDVENKELAEIKLNGSILFDELPLILEETSETSGRFTGQFSTQFATSADKENDILEITGKETVTATYTDELQTSGATKVVVQDSATVNTGDDGLLSIVRSNYLTDVETFNAGDTLYFYVRDGDEEDNHVEITVAGDVALFPSEKPRLSHPKDVTNDTARVVMLRSSATESSFLGKLSTQYAKIPADDDTLQVTGNEKIEVTYIDRLRASGQSYVPVKDYCEVNVGTKGKLTVYNKSGYNNSPDAVNEPVESLRAGDTLLIVLEDEDLNILSERADSFEVTAKTDNNRDSVLVVVRESGADSGVFIGELSTAFGEVDTDDDILQIQGHETVTVEYLDAVQDTGETKVPMAVHLMVEAGEKGTLELYNVDGTALIGSFSAGDTILIKLKDSDLAKQSADTIISPTADVTITGNVLNDEVILTLTLNADGTFQAYLRTEYAETAGVFGFSDDILHIKDKELITVTYLDSIVATGETNVPISQRAFVLSSSVGLLLIVDEHLKELGGFNSGRTIHFWLKDLLLSTVKELAEANITVYGNKTNDTAEVTLYKHPIESGTFFGSIPTRYGSTPIDDDTLDVVGDEEITAVYMPDFPGIHNLFVTDKSYINKGTRGRILIVRSDGTKIKNFNIGTTLYFRMEDADENFDPFAVDTADLWVKSNAEGIGKTVALRETGENSGVFVGRLKTEYGRLGGKPDVLELIGGEIVTAVYRDNLVETGETNVDITDISRANAVGWATYTSKRVIIDGREDKWPLENTMETSQGEAQLWTQWDDFNLYILLQVKDDNVVVPDVARWWMDSDALEIHIALSPIEDAAPAYISNGEAQNYYILWFCPQGAGIDGKNDYAGQAQPEYRPNYAPPIDMAFLPFDGYYQLEIKIPFDSVLGGFDPMKSTRIDRIGFNYIVYRSDAPSVSWATPEKADEKIMPGKLGVLYLKRPTSR